MVSIGIMNTQINLRLPNKMLISAKKKAKNKGFKTIQEYIKEIIRTDLFDTITKKEEILIKKIIKITEKNNLS